MFRNDKPHDPMNKPAEPVSAGKINSIMEGTSIEGEVKSDSNIRIDGKVKGTIHVRGRLIVGASGLMEGDVTCQSSDIEGTVNGKVICQDLLTLKATARLTGDIHTKKLAIEPGAIFSGNCVMGAPAEKEREPQTQPQRSTATSAAASTPAAASRVESTKADH